MRINLLLAGAVLGVFVVGTVLSIFTALDTDDPNARRAGVRPPPGSSLQQQQQQNIASQNSNHPLKAVDLSPPSTFGAGPGVGGIIGGGGDPIAAAVRGAATATTQPAAQAPTPQAQAQAQTDTVVAAAAVSNGGVQLLSVPENLVLHDLLEHPPHAAAAHAIERQDHQQQHEQQQHQHQEEEHVEAVEHQEAEHQRLQHVRQSNAHQHDSAAEREKAIQAIQCPDRQASLEDSATRNKYNNLLAKYGTQGHDLHEYSFYKMPRSSWDLILKSHVDMLGYKKGDWIFESGSAAGATLDSLQRQYGVNIAGADIAEELVDFATVRLAGGKFCAANARDLSFIPSNIFDHTLAFAVYMYIGSVPDMCRATKELLRIVRPGGTVFLGQINDQTRDKLRNSMSEGPSTVGPLYWYRFAHDMGVKDVRVLRAGEVYSQRKVPEMTTYDLHATVRYNVYFRKPDTLLDFDGTDCNAVESNLVSPRVTEDGQECYLPFYYKDAIFDDCTTIDDGKNREWCALKRVVTQDEVFANPSPTWGYCKPKPYPTRADFWGDQ